MIHVDRSAVNEPRALKGLRDAGLKHAQKFFVDTPVEERRQVRYFNPYWQKAYRVPIPALVELFHGKCAYCESKVNPDADGILDHFRPKWATRGKGKEYAPDHYWWLAFAWSNLYLSCPNCNRQRGPRFPVEGRRIRGPEESVEKEHPLLIDPCRDNPDDHLRFEESGRVTHLDPQGEATIGLLALNRSDLVHGRRRVIQELDAAYKALGSPLRRHPSRSVIDTFNAFLARDAEFSACARHVLSRRLESRGIHLRGLNLDPTPTRVRKKRVASSLAPQDTARFIDAVHLTNFRGIASLSLRTASPDQTNLDWLMLLGENAAGKSSILQAIALNLMSDADRTKLDLDPLPFIKRGSSSARVEINFRNDETPRVLTITRRGFTPSDGRAGAPLMAYGATRLPPLVDMSERRMDLENLFNPFAPLLDPVAWLVGLATGDAKARTDFDYAAHALAALLPGTAKKWRFRRLRDDIIVEPEGPLRQLSDGYQSVIALACDIMATVHRSFRGGMEAAEGIVLIDELGAHLHPQWKMRLTAVLRKAFPRLQCIATTHDPLCLRGLRNGETATIEKTKRGRVFARTDLPPIEGMRVDQILLSEYFGLRSSMDPAIEADFDRMYRLKAKPPSSLTPKQRRTMAKLEVRLAPHAIPGATRAERLMLTEINRYLAREREQPDKKKRDAGWAAAQTKIADRIEKELGIAL